MMNKSWLREVVRGWFEKSSDQPHPRLFSAPKWQDQAKLWYLLYRWLIFFVWSFILVSSLCEFGSVDPKGKTYLWPIYITNWALVFGATQACLGLILVSRTWKLQKAHVDLDQRCYVDKLEKSFWFLSNITTTLALGVSITYWTAVHDPKIHFVDLLNIMTHVLNSVLMILDLFVIGVPFTIRNFWLCFVVTVVYIVFSIVYYVAGGIDRQGNHYIYKILDWEKPGRTLLICVAVVTFLFVIHCLLHLLSALADKIYGKYSNTRKGRGNNLHANMASQKQPTELVV